MKIGIFHYWLIAWRGGEKVLAEIIKSVPPADLWCHVSSEDICRKVGYDPAKIRHTLFSRIPHVERIYKLFSPLCYLASLLVGSSQYELIISSESGPIKGLTRGKDSVHVCYCHSPFRILWVPLDWYGKKLGSWRYLLALLRWPLRQVDRWTAHSVDRFIANSSYTQNRISQAYHRESVVIHPPVDVDRFSVSKEKDDYFLWLGELVSYKRPDLVIDAFNANGMPLVVAGMGEMMELLKTGAGPNVSFAGRVSDDELPELLSRARALLFAGVEDFGIVFVEALASGTPVIALAKGGVLDIVIDMETGILFKEQSVRGLHVGLNRFLQWEAHFNPSNLNKAAQKFSAKRFRKEFRAVLNKELEKRGMTHV